MRIHVSLSFAFILGIARGCWAQTSAITQVKAPSGVVTGHILCADTRRPGRFAEVALLRQQNRPAQSTAPAGIGVGIKSNGGEIVYASAWSGLDGAYAIRNVPPGDYFVIARMDGYIDPVQSLAYGNGVDDPFAEMRADIPVAHVVASETVQVDLTLRRGGMISGQVQFEDATPVVGAVVRVEPAEDMKSVSYATSAPLTEVVGHRHQGTTDDEGRYRIAGLESGKYRIFTMIPLERETWITSYGDPNAQQFSKSTPGSSGKAAELLVYQPKTFRQTEATVFDIKGDDKNTDADIEIPLNTLHSIRGRLKAKADGHVPDFAVVNVFVEGEFGRIARVSADGSFQVDYLPKGTYTITTQASDHETASGDLGTPPRELRRYERIKTTVILDEQNVTLDDLIVAEAKPEK
jgi:hypothetical protein